MCKQCIPIEKQRLHYSKENKNKEKAGVKHERVSNKT